MASRQASDDAAARNNAGDETSTSGRDLPSKLGGGLEGTPAFLLASDDEIREAYRDDLKLVASLLKLANECIHAEPIGSPRWLDGAKWIDAARDAVDIHGWAGARRARMFLLAAIDGAVFHGDRLRTFAEPLRIMATLGQRQTSELSPAERAQCKQAAAKLIDMPTDSDAKRFTEETGEDPTQHVALFAAFIFRLRCPKFARGLVSQEGSAALNDAIASWPRTKGRPKKGDSRLPKWEAADALMKAAGLVGSTPESLESDWKEWGARRLNK